MPVKIDIFYLKNRFSVHAALNLLDILTKLKYGQDAAAHSDDDCYLFQSVFLIQSI